ncbi:S-adenosyl-L-methionine-dependent methyltransferase [Phycomyces blakesleeanus]
MSKDFEASKLGTKSYWDNVYDRENDNFKELGDIGEIWFGEDSVERMVDWAVDNVEDTNSSVIDLGCGNGHLLLALSEEGFSNLTGIDYSESAIVLAKSVAKDRDLESIEYKAVDFLNSDEWRQDNKLYQVVLDKGTYDAISLNPEEEEAKKENKAGPRELYIQAVHRMISPDGVFLITSCNWTMEELKEAFKQYFRYHSHVKYPTFSFGGQTGSKICTVAFSPLKQ